MIVKRLVAAVVMAATAAALSTDGTVLPMLEMPVVQAQGARCAWTAEFTNTRRRLKGSLDQECPKWYLPEWLEHSVPWGNFGVNSRYQRRRDSDQWAGWHPKEGFRQWSACTKGEHARPNPEFYNDGGGWTQRSSPDRVHWHATHRRRGPRGRTCDSLYGNVYVYRNVYMTLYELDAGGFPFGGDDKVTALRFGNVSVPVNCGNDDWHCSGVPAGSPPITINGQPIEPAPNVWTIQEPIVEPDDGDEEEQKSSSGSPFRTGLLAGAFWGCVYGIAAGTPPSDISRGGLCVLNGMFFAGVGAGVGALVTLFQNRRAPDDPDP